MKKPTQYKGTFTEVEITEGTGNAKRFGREAKFLAHYGARLAQLLREEELLAVGVDEGVYVNAVAFPDGLNHMDTPLKGVFSKSNLEIDEALKLLNWKNPK